MSARARQMADVHLREPREPQESVDRFAEWCRTVGARWPLLDADERFELLLQTLRQVPSHCAAERHRVRLAQLIEEVVERYLRAPADARTGAERLPPAAPATPGSVRREGVSFQHARVAMALLATRCSDPHLTLTALAEAVGVSKWHLSRVLTRVTGLGFRALLARSRVAMASDLLQSTGLSVKEIAGRSGYEHVSNLDRHFRQISGTTPCAYRQMCPAPNAGATRRSSG